MRSRLFKSLATSLLGTLACRVRLDGCIRKLRALERRLWECRIG